jgi:hypothetical protein
MYKPDQRALQEREREKESAEKVIEQMSRMRKEQIEIFGNNNPRTYDLEKQYGKYLFVPLALPIFELPEKDHFFSWWSKNMAVTKKLDGDAVMSGYGITPFETVDLINEIGNQWWESNNQQTGFKTEFPKLWQQFHDQLPMKILRLTLWSSRHEIQEHRDSAECVDLPASFRMMLYDDNPTETLYVLDNPLRPFTSENAHMINRAPNTNSFVWNNLRCKHGSVYNPGYKKVLAFAAGIFDVNRYGDLLEQSVNTYKDYCITSKYSIENYINP